MEIPKLGNITPHPFQWGVIENTKNFIRKQLKKEIENQPSFINAYVSAGKTIIAGAIAVHCQNVGARLLILARTGELVEQDAEEVFNMGGECSIYSASLGQKSTYFSTVVGTEGTVANALNSDFANWIPHIILIDECHEVSWEDVINQTDNQYAKIINHFKRLNPNVVIVGMTGSPYRGIESIKGPFWKHEIEPAIGRQFLVENEYIVPTNFGYGHDETNYDLSEFDSFEDSGTKDFTADDINQMHSKMSLKATELIMNEVQDVMKNRLCALVTCAGHKHCEEAASYVPEDEFAIVTEKTKKKDRQQILRDAKKGKLNDRGTFRYKYIFQVGCLTTGVNVPLWDTSVLLRRIGSLTLLTQLLGRGMRLLKDEHEADGYSKSDHLCLDYSGTMNAMHEMFDDPMLEDAAMSKARQDDAFVHCPECEAQCGAYSRKCHNCGHWFKYRECEDLKINGILIEEGCGAKNDIAAKVCCECNKYLIDPNAKLTHKAYTDADWKPVKKMELSITGKNSDAIKVKYWLDSYGLDGKQEIATVNYWAIQAGGKRVWQAKFCNTHCRPAMKRKAGNMTAAQVMQNLELFKKPIMATHRINAKGESIVNVSYKRAYKNEV